MADIKKEETGGNTIKYKVIAEYLNIRTEPNICAAVVKNSPIKKGAEIDGLPQTETKSDNLTWVKVIFNGKECYGAKDYLNEV